MIIKCSHGVSMAHCKVCKPQKFLNDRDGWKTSAQDAGMEIVTASQESWGISHAMKDGKICGGYEESFNADGHGFLILGD